MNIYDVPKSELAGNSALADIMHQDASRLGFLSESPYGYKMRVLKCVGRVCAECWQLVNETGRCPECGAALLGDHIYGHCTTCGARLCICYNHGEPAVIGISKRWPCLSEEPADTI